MRISGEGSVQVGVGLDPNKQAKLVDAAQGFEATMLQELLKPMQHGQKGWGGDPDGDDDGADTLSTYGTETMAKAISEAGGFGIAKQIVSKVTAEGAKTSERQVSRY
jgi:flagellar protein FlgJ